MKSTAVVLLGFLAAALPARAVSYVFVDKDPNRACAGLKPCFPTIQQGVNNATAAVFPAEIAIFPGAYAESVDLSMTGSAVGGSPGDIRLVGVTAAGNPHPGTVSIVPPAGPALTASGPPFPGDVVIDGLRVTSADGDAVALTVTGEIRLLRLTAQGAAGRGAVLDAGGDVQIVESTFTANGGKGCEIDSGGGVVIEESAATGNGSGPGDDGFSVNSAALHLEVRGSRASDNAGTGFDLTSDAGTGAPVTVSQTRSIRNGGAGLDLMPDGPLLTEQVVAEDNASDGIRVSATAGATVEVNGARAAGNGAGGAGAGISVNTAGAVTLSEIVALDNRDDGLWVTASSATLTRVRSNGNGDDGIDVTTTSGAVTADRVEADSNTNAGLRVSAAGAFTASEVRAADNGGAGIEATSAGDTSVERTLVAGNTADGLRVDSGGSVSITRSCARVNAQDGFRIAAAGGDITVAASNSERNGAAGLRFESISGGGAYRVERNNVTGNGDGLRNDTAPIAIDAEDNWWGAPTGPTHPSNPTGTGDSVVDSANGGAGTVDFTPRLTFPAATETPCSPQPVPAAGPIAIAAMLGLLALIGARAHRRAHG